MIGWRGVGRGTGGKPDGGQRGDAKAEQATPDRGQLSHLTTPLAFVCRHGL
jgi:hypothetical protein